MRGSTDPGWLSGDRSGRLSCGCGAGCGTHCSVQAFGCRFSALISGHVTMYPVRVRWFAGDLVRRHACRVSLLSCIRIINPLPHPKHRYCTYWPYPGTMRSPRNSPGDPHREHTAFRSSNRRPHPQHRRMRRTVCAPEPAVVMSSIWFRHPQKGQGGDASPPVPPAPPGGYGVFRVLSNTRTHRSPGLRRARSASGWRYPVPFAPAGGFPAGTGRLTCSVSYTVMGAPTV